MVRLTSDKHRLLRLVSPFVVVILLQAFLAGLSLEVLSSVRAYVAGEGSWSKGQKDASHFITLYSQTGDELYFRQFQTAIAVPLADRSARHALELDTPNLDAARDGFIGGGNHPDDVAGMIWLFRYFRDVPYMATAVERWRETDPFLEQLKILGDAVHEEHLNASGGPVHREILKHQIDLIDRQLAPAATAFSRSLGEGSRSIKFLLTVANLLTAMSLIFLILWHTRKMLRQRLAFEASERELVARLSWQASHDTLTGLANRREFESRLEGALGVPAGDHSSLMFLDLDQFKIVNDTCGHAAGDQLLKQTSSLLEQTLGNDALLARLGGDEFAVIVHGQDADAVSRTAERLRLAVQDLRFGWNGRSFNISVSIGLVNVAEAATAEEALRAADMACYMAKEKGRNRVQVYHPSDSELVQRVGEMGWVQKIRNGLEERRFCLFAQPIRALSTGESQQSHFEMLLRLRDEEGRLMAPGTFLPAAERYGLMPLIDRWVVKNAFQLLAGRLHASGAPPITTCAINLSGVTIGDDEFVGYVRRQFELYGIPPAIVCFEITESSAIADMSSARRFIEALRKLGCRFSLDDFGTGMSSFAYLKHLPFDYIKIDGSFVKGIESNPIDRAMVEMIVQVAKVAGKRSIAEFVESEGILEILQEIGVDYAQGYAIGKPKPFEDAFPAVADMRLEVA